MDHTQGEHAAGYYTMPTPLPPPPPPPCTPRPLGLNRDGPLPDYNPSAIIFIDNTPSRGNEPILGTNQKSAFIGSEKRTRGITYKVSCVPRRTSLSPLSRPVHETPTDDLSISGQEDKTFSSTWHARAAARPPR